MSIKALEIVNKQLQKEVDNYRAAMGDGACVDYAAYKNLCGVIRGLTIAQQHIHALARANEDSDE